MNLCNKVLRPSPLPCSLPHRFPSQYRSVGTVNTAGSGLNQHTILRQSPPGHRRPIVDVEDKVPDVHTLGCIKRPTFQKMFSIASVTRIYLLHILKPSTIPILKCIWGHLGGPHPPWSSQNFLNPIIMVKTSKLSYRAHRTLIRKLLTRQRYFKCAKIVCYWYFQVIQENEITATVILFFVCIFQNIGNRKLSLSKNCCSFRKLSNEHTLSSVR